MTRALVLLVLAACQRDNHVALELGQLEGFLCEDPTTDAPLYDRAHLPGTSTYDFVLYVDLVQYGATTPSCFGEDIVKACSGNTPDEHCQSKQVACIPIDEPVAGFSLDEVEQKLADAGNLIQDAPDGAVTFRAVAMVGSCDAPRQPATTSNVIGCVYSCPEVLDDISGNLELQLGLLGIGSNSPACIAEVVGCANFTPQ